MDIERIDHIHYVAKDHDKVKAIMTAVTGREPNFFHDYTPEAGCIVSFWNFPRGFQILAVTDPSKIWGDMLTDFKPGIQTISMLVHDIDECIPELEGMGYKMIRDTVAASGGVREVTFDTFSVFGFNLELMQYTDSFNN